jgi:hypothetical protein
LNTLILLFLVLNRSHGASHYAVSAKLVYPCAAHVPSSADCSQYTLSLRCSFLVRENVSLDPREPNLNTANNILCTLKSTFCTECLVVLERDQGKSKVVPKLNQLSTTP